MKSRRTTFPADALALLSVCTLAAETVEMFSTSGRGCCIGWIKHLKEAGFDVMNENLAIRPLIERLRRGEDRRSA